MSYSEIINRIEENGYEKTFDELYQEYKKTKAIFKEKELELERLKTDWIMASGQIEHYLNRAINVGLAIKDDDSHFVRRIVGNEYVYFKMKKDGNFFIGYETLSNFDSIKDDK